MSNSCTFNQHVGKVVKTCKQLMGRILRTISSREKFPMLTVYKSVILPRLEYGCQLWNPNACHLINSLERVQRSITKYIKNMYDISYEERLSTLKLYSLQRRRDIYLVIYIWKILEKLVSNLSPPIEMTNSARLGCMCFKRSVPPGHQGTLMYNSFRWQAVRLY